jgi:hypothetical protein
MIWVSSVPAGDAPRPFARHSAASPAAKVKAVFYGVASIYLILFNGIDGIGLLHQLRQLSFTTPRTRNDWPHLRQR